MKRYRTTGHPDSRKRSSQKYEVLVKPEGDTHFSKTGEEFSNLKDAITFANIERTAGYGEEYIIRPKRKRKRKR